ncbi:uncharacterized protein L3040_000101 [Drepanopeziza brunnea f. sp. 'multigermtubi']|uniref:Base excision DNA repair protein n=1 Tax=Marssonina brunnea f. sp. multigermtubi (strain MB_m1) TaxID=1072389 RepID=K1XPW1_MARBU|nr:base excision DNA repair protein [Drepanopeziza brunnea f. sp. 'multigermtubi' MB_m1]EKD14579.1 base excision DNA repair protein [Drepanopeziza brunnea f. sp. 'multigermtubi' MB_m1]KAJ5053810.1 hypothetical protein L3040_000101 [Drepanopeziza brunnea f. sp. 'multigermtubi']
MAPRTSRSSPLVATIKAKSKSPSPLETAESKSSSLSPKSAKSKPEPAPPSITAIFNVSKRKAEDKPHGMGLDLGLAEPAAKRTKTKSTKSDSQPALFIPPILPELPLLEIKVVPIPEPVVVKHGAKVKQHPYKLTYGASPFPDHLEPSPKACEEVYHILSGSHGHSRHPSEMPLPSLEVAGCGEVPSLLDALMRTILSGNTSMENANKKLIGLRDAFGLCQRGAGAGSIDWDRVYRAERSLVVEATKRGGSQEKKTDEIQRTMSMIYENNCIRYSALLRQKETGEPCTFRGLKPESSEEIDAEIMKFEKEPLTMHYVFQMTDEDAMEELIQYYGVGVKTASCVMLFCLQRNSFAVDTHVHRFCRWLGWVPFRVTMKNKEPRKVSENETFSHCDVRVPNHLKYGLHQLFIKHGQDCYRCVGGNMPGTPKWDECVCPLEHLLTRHEKLPGFLKPRKQSNRLAEVEEEGVEEEMIEAEVVEPKSGRAKAAKPKMAKSQVLKAKDGEQSVGESAKVKVESDEKLAAATDVKVVTAKGPAKRKPAASRKPAAKAAKVTISAKRKPAARGANAKKAVVQSPEPEKDDESDSELTDLEMTDEGEGSEYDDGTGI